MNMKLVITVVLLAAIGFSYADAKAVFAHVLVSIFTIIPQ